ncbi:MAG: HEAT repeat domain-containing protein [Actinomycetota bacterium]|nr:HEAT repeat domain-containing protein [Actinomycetota bacterium]
MVHDPGTDDPTFAPEEWRRRREAALAGYRRDRTAARRYLGDRSGRVRATALAALARLEDITADELTAALADADPHLRRRACELAVGGPDVDLVPLLADADASVAEAAAWALGERGGCGNDDVGPNRAAGRVIEALVAMAAGHDDALCREAAVAALGALGDERALPAILAATTDKPAVRRRAVIALAPFDGADVRAALRRARSDRDWQVRQAAEDLTDEPAAGEGPP